MAIVKMDRIENDDAYGDGAGTYSWSKTVSSSDGDSDIIMVPNQVESVSFSFDVETGSGTGTVFVTASTRADVISGDAIWEEPAEGEVSTNMTGSTNRGVTAVKCNRSAGTVSLTVRSAHVRGMG